jgi:hypothetical protein
MEVIIFVVMRVLMYDIFGMHEKYYSNFCDKQDLKAIHDFTQRIMVCFL